MHPHDNAEALLRVLTAPRRNQFFYGKRMDVQHFRMEQEVPEAVARKGRLFQFPVRGDYEGSALMLWPGFTPIEKDVADICKD